MASNCWGGEVYRDFGLPYNTPFVGLYLYAPCFLRLASDLERRTAGPLRFAATSRYVGRASYPVGELEDGIELHFVHYSGEREAREKWERRLGRMSFAAEKVRLMLCDRDAFAPELLAGFDALPFPHKVCFTARPHPQPSAVWVRSCADEPCVVAGDRLYGRCKPYFDVAGWLNGDSGRPCLLSRVEAALLGVAVAPPSTPGAAPAP